MAKPKKRKKQPATQSKPVNPAEDGAVHLEETIEHVSDSVRSFFTQYRIPLIVVFAAVVVVFAVTNLWESADASRVASWNSAYYAAITGKPGTTPTNEEIKANLEKVIADHEGEECAGWMMANYASWLMGTGDDAYRARAFEIIDQAATKFPDEPVIKVISARYAEIRTTDDGFTLPEPPAKPEPTTTTPEVKVGVGPDGKVTPSVDVGDATPKPPTESTLPPLPTSQPAGGGN